RRDVPTRRARRGPRRDAPDEARRERAEHDLRHELRRRRRAGGGVAGGRRARLPDRRRGGPEVAGAVRRARPPGRQRAAAPQRAPPAREGHRHGRGGHLAGPVPLHRAADDQVPCRADGSRRPLLDKARRGGARLPAARRLARGPAPGRGGAARREGLVGAAREVLMATVAAGGGHVATARAMAEAVAEASDGELTARVVDVMAEHAPRLDARHKAGWRALLARPRLIRASQAVMDAAPAASRTVQGLVLSGFTRRVTAALNARPPALVVVNHGWLATSFTAARRRHGLASRVVVLATEPFDASALWSAPGAETVLAPSAAAAEDLVRLGVARDAVHVSRYPVARRFHSPPRRAEARARLDRRAARPAVAGPGRAGRGGLPRARARRPAARPPLAAPAGPRARRGPRPARRRPRPRPPAPAPRRARRPPAATPPRAASPPRPA